MTQDSEETMIARLDERVGRIEKDVVALGGQIEKIKDEVSALRRFQAWLLGGAAAIGAVISHFGSAITDKLK